MSSKFRRARLAAIGIIALVSGCMSDHKSPTDVVQTSAVTIAHFAFSPASAVVPVGTTITWTNQDAAAHTVTGADFDSGSLAQNATFSHTFATKGTFAYHCKFHSSMVASVTVQ